MRAHCVEVLEGPQNNCKSWHTDTARARAPRADTALFAPLGPTTPTTSREQQPVWLAAYRQMGDALLRAEKLAAKKQLVGASFFEGANDLAARGLAPSLIFFLRGLFETSIFFGLIFAAQWPLMSNNLVLVANRDTCRRLYVEGNPDPPGCGYAGHFDEGQSVVMSHSLAPVAGLARYAYSACEEFIDGEWQGRALLKNFWGATVDTVSASYCATGGFNTLTLLYWYADLLLVLFFLWRMQQLEAVVEKESDEHVWTTADYAVMLHGLDRGIPLEQARRIP